MVWSLFLYLLVDGSRLSVCRRSRALETVIYPMSDAMHSISDLMLTVLKRAWQRNQHERAPMVPGIFNPAAPL